MTQESIVQSLVKTYQSEPRNKIIIDARDLIPFASEELGTEISVIQLAESLRNYKNGEPSDEDQSLLDAATALCHQVADRCWGEIEDEEYDEWSEVDISTEWSNFDSEDPSELFVTIYQD